ncbi:MAG: ammonium transporter [Nitrospiraceae bacterium]|nr:MAG: ammonium transporter [Nitrospiraceae bacterium]
MIIKKIFTAFMLLVLGLPLKALAEETASINSGDTAWMIVATALVLFMTIPGLSLFYGGLVRSKNVLSIFVQCFAITCLMSVLWVIYGYSVAFDGTGMEAGAFNFHSLFGGLNKMFLSEVGVDSVSGTIPETVFLIFQMTFAIITPALMVGAFAERMKFSAVMLFVTIWFTFSYLPICHMAWGGDGALFANWGVLDFAGGTVVHVNAGIAALVACLMVGKRKGFGEVAMLPHNVPFVIIGTGMLWVGWFGFNAGSELAADGTAGMAMLVTQIATATAALSWMFVEWIRSGKPTAVGIATGAVAGLVAITPASGTAGPMGALLIGATSGTLCYFAATSMKRALGYDDSLDVFGVHGVGGMIGATLTGLCAAEFMGGAGIEAASIGAQIWAQIKSIIVTLVWSGIVALIALKVIDAVIGIRAEDSNEVQGLDISDHEEAGYNIS